MRTSQMLASSRWLAALTAWMAADHRSPTIGRVGTHRLRIESDGEEVVNSRVAEMEAVWRSSLKLKLQAEAMAAGAE